LVSLDQFDHINLVITLWVIKFSNFHCKMNYRFRCQTKVWRNRSLRFQGGSSEGRHHLEWGNRYCQIQAGLSTTKSYNIRRRLMWSLWASAKLITLTGWWQYADILIIQNKPTSVISGLAIYIHTYISKIATTFEAA
jgi:hypothetical protein